jgi:glycosyltransferase involved in cell wall biosynthesis
MRILIIVDCYLPSIKSGARMVHDLGVEFHRQGHDVTILTASDTSSCPFVVRMEEGLRIARVKTGKIKGTDRVLRAVREVRLSATLWRKARHFLVANPADLIVFYAPTIFFGALVRRLKSQWGCPAYLILRDIFPQWAVDAGILRKGLIWRYFRKKEIEQYEAADRIAVESAANLQYFGREFALRRYPVEVLYNWMNTYGEDLPSTNYREHLGLQDKVVFFYGGNLGVAQDVDNIIRLAGRLAGEDYIRFVLVGEGSEVPRLRRFLAENRVQNVRLLPAVSHREYLAMLSEFDVGLLSLDRRLETYNVPGKLLGYMYWGKPVLASINPGNDLFAILENDQAGFCRINGDDDSLCAAALRLANDPDLRDKMGANSRRLLERLFSVDAAVRQILNQFQEQVTSARKMAPIQPDVSLQSAGRL